MNLFLEIRHKIKLFDTKLMLNCSERKEGLLLSTIIGGAWWWRPGGAVVIDRTFLGIKQIS